MENIGLSLSIKLQEIKSSVCEEYKTKREVQAERKEKYNNAKTNIHSKVCFIKCLIIINRNYRNRSIVNLFNIF